MDFQRTLSGIFMIMTFHTSQYLELLKWQTDSCMLALTFWSKNRQLDIFYTFIKYIAKKASKHHLHESQMIYCRAQTYRIQARAWPSWTVCSPACSARHSAGGGTGLCTFVMRVKSADFVKMLKSLPVLEARLIQFLPRFNSPEEFDLLQIL